MLATAAVAVADTLAHGGPFSPFSASRETLELMEGWHEFYLLAGTAAVTMMALLYVALALHLDVLLHENKAHLLTHARQTLLSYIFVLVMSLMFLIPFQNARMIGITLTALGVVGLGVQIVTLMSSRRSARDGEHDRFLARRTRVLFVGYGGIFVIGLAIALTHVPYFTYYLVGFVCMLLGNAAGSSWDLLVQVGKIKRAQEMKEKEAAPK